VYISDRKLDVGESIELISEGRGLMRGRRSRAEGMVLVVLQQRELSTNDPQHQTRIAPGYVAEERPASGCSGTPAANETA
jgi:hypothetical protein